VPNGGYEPDILLGLLCGQYRFRYGEWPKRLEVSPRALWGLAVRLDYQNLARVAERLEIRSVRIDRSDPLAVEPMTVSGDAGSVVMNEIGAGWGITEAEGYAWLACQEEAPRWLGIEARETPR
jgi:hypothetical protein